MNTQTITWTALPNGVVRLVDQTVLRLSVFISPRLESDDKSATLDQFPDFLDWPETLFPADDRREVIFKVQFGSNPPVQAWRTGNLPDSSLWRSLFTDSTLLEPYEFKNFKDRPIQSYPVKNIQSFLRQQYVSLATGSGEEFPSSDSLVKDQGAPFRPLAFSIRENSEEKVTAEILSELERYRFIPTGSINDPDGLAKSFLQAKLFHQPFSTKRIQITRPSIDFHRMISLLGDYPYLLQRLGLVLDLELPVPAKMLADNNVQVIATWMPKSSPVQTVNVPDYTRRHATRCYVTQSDFYAMPRQASPELADGMLPFEDSRKYEVVRIDPDSAAVKTISFAGNLGIARSVRKTDDTPETSSLPSIRTGGLAVARLDRAEVTHNLLTRQDALNQDLLSAADTLLDAEDITRGYRVDVWDSASGKWHSLCQRVGTYRFLRADPPIVEKAEDEGCITMSMTSAADDSSETMRLGEPLFTWQGWSLAAPRPGKTLDADGKPAEQGNEIDPDFQLEARFKPKPGSLPRLRYGIGYRLRARAVDLAGNSLSPTGKPIDQDKHSTSELVYGRFEPVPPPVVVMRSRRTEGDSVERLVIRSNYDKPIEVPAERHIVPPKTSQTMAEYHGVFDNTENGQVDFKAYDVIVPREAGTITGTPDENNYGQPYVDEDEMVTPFLPDVISRGAVLRDLPGTSGPYAVDFGYGDTTEWPDGLPFRLVLAEHETAKASFYESPRVLEILLPKADVVRVRLSSGMRKDDTMLMGLIHWIMESGQDENGAIALAVEGRHWMITPYRTLTLVHAVRQPLRTPEFDQVFVSRSVGQTFASLEDRSMSLSRKSTVKLDFTAEWTENVDPVGEAGPRVLSVKARPFEFPVPLVRLDEKEDTLYVHGRHEFNDTKYRRMTYSATATTRFSEYFTQRIKGVKLTGTAPVELSAEGIVESSEAVELEVNTASYKRYDPANKTGDYVMDYRNGTIRRTGGTEPAGDIPENTELEITFLAPPITREMASPRTLDVLSASRPAAPKILYVVPVFEWQTVFSGRNMETIESRRIGSSIRIYMERPWFSSGDGELLGVVIWPGPSSISISKNPQHEKIKQYVTQWGLDPLFLSEPVVALPTLDAFKLSKQQHKATDLILEEVPDANLKVNLAGHEVAYDSERRLWYCDMQIDAGDTYFPFVRLALARYQPNSLYRAVTGPDTVVDYTRDNVHLSRVVLADFVQLAPDRFASVARDTASPLVRHVSVTGFSYRMLTGQQGPGRMEISLEQRRSGIDPAVAGELAWEPVVSSTTVMANTLQKDGSTTWTGDVTLPNDADPFRLVIKEFEIYSIPGLVPIEQRRLVYADTISLNP